MGVVFFFTAAAVFGGSDTFHNSLGLPRGSTAEIRNLPVPPQKETPILAKSGLKAPPTLACIPRESITDTHTSSLGQLSDSTEPCALSYATQSHRQDNRFLCRSRYEQRNFSQIGYSASIVTKVRSSCRSIARSARLANGVNEAVARRARTAVQGRFWLQGLGRVEFAIPSVAVFGRFLIRTKSKYFSNRQQQQQQIGNFGSS